MSKEELIKLLQRLPEDAVIYLEETSSDGTPNFKNIKEICYEEYNGVYLVK